VTGCIECGKPTPYRRCQTHRLAHRGPQTDDAEYDCPECDGPTSGEGALCHHCRRDDQ